MEYRRKTSGNHDFLSITVLIKDLSLPASEKPRRLYIVFKKCSVFYCTIKDKIMQYMTKISNKQKEAISKIYLFSIVATDIRYKLSFLTQLYAAIRSALLAAGVVECDGRKVRTAAERDKNGKIVKDKDGNIVEAKDPLNSATLLNECKVYLYEAYTSFASRGSWIKAEQEVIEVVERLSALGYGHEFIDVDDQQWNASYYLIAPNGGAQSAGDDD